MVYGDTDQNLRHNVNFKVYTLYPLLPMRRAAAAIGRPWRLGRFLLPLPLPSLPPRFVGAFPYPPPHMLIGTCQAAQPLFSCRAARSRFFTPYPLTSA